MPKSAVVAPALRESLRQFKAEIFRVLAHPKRIHIVEYLIAGERCVRDIQEEVGIEAPAVSQHLAVLRAKNLVTTRKEGTQVFYALRDPLLADVLDTMRRYFQAHLKEAMDLLHGLHTESRT